MVSLLLSSTMILTSSASSEGIVLSADSSKLEYKYNQRPIISGNVTDMGGNPLSNVSVFASIPYVKSDKGSSDSDGPIYSSTIFGFTTFSDGKFLLKPKNPSPPGEHTIKVTAKKGQMEESIFVTFNVKEHGIKKRPIDADAKASMERTILSYSLLEQKMETQKEQYKEIQNPKNKVNVSPQVVEQQVTSNNLESDLKQLEEKYASNSPRNAFARFIETIDQTLQNLFWDQFEFTENKTEKAQLARNDALNDGQTSQQAMKVFQKEAETTRAEIIEFNEMLNIKYGFANQTVQDTFDENGKLSRIGE